ncbi:MAG: fibronectin type III domain-containing protein [Gammaproteobacteria bacterium]|nr:fibronectin type III domain-containing protein [Gammaproteobacteria bacterium]
MTIYPVRARGGRVPVIEATTTYRKKVKSVEEEVAPPEDEPEEPTGTPGAPTNLRLSNVTVKRQTIIDTYTDYYTGTVLSWDAPVDDGGGIEGYQIEFDPTTIQYRFSPTNDSPYIREATNTTVIKVPAATSYTFRESGRPYYQDSAVEPGPDPPNFTPLPGARRAYGRYRWSIRVRAFNKFGNGGWSGVLSLNNKTWSYADPAGGDCTVPPAIAGFTATPGNARITLSWSKPAGAINTYKIERRTRAKNTGAWGAYSEISASSSGISKTATSVTDTGLTNGSGYQYKIWAVNDCGEGEESTTSASGVVPVAQVVTPNTRPGKPGAPTVTAGDTTVGYVLKAPTTGGTPTDYDVRYRRKTGTNTWTSPTGVTHAGIGTTGTIRNLTNGQVYQVSSRAGNNVGESAWSDWSSEVTPTGLVPPAPRNLSITKQILALSLTWLAPTTNIAIKNYTVEWQTVTYAVLNGVRTLRPSATTTVTTTSRGYRLTGADATKEYRFRVRANSSTDTNGTFTSWSSPTRPLAQPPPRDIPPTLAAPGVTAGNGTVRVIWTVPSGGGTVTQIKIWRQEKAATLNAKWSNLTVKATVGTSPQSYNDDSVTNGKIYRYAVQAINTEEEGKTSPTSRTVIPFGVPGKPQLPRWSIRNTTILGTPSTSVSGSPPSQYPTTNGAPIIAWEYSLQFIFPAQGAQWQYQYEDLRVSASLSRAFARKTANTSYRLRIRAVNKAGHGPWSNWTSVKRP